MSYKLVLFEQNLEGAKDVGENVFLENLPIDYKIYLFYYPGEMSHEDLETKLADFGKRAGRNLFVNLGKLNDPNYHKLANHFQIKALPVIVITATSDLASPPNLLCSVFARIDSKHLLDSSGATLELVEKVFNLFIGGRIAEGLKEVKKEDWKFLLTKIGDVIKGAFQGLGKFINDRDFTFAIFGGKFEIKKS